MKTFQQFCENIRPTARITIKKIDGEWAVAWFMNNRLDDGKTYYSGGDTADYKQDCVNTAKHMQKEIDSFNATGKFH